MAKERSDPRPAQASGDRRLRGAAIYNRRVLLTYDLLVLGVVSRFVWRCRRSEMARLYERNVGERHLDIGPGTAFFLDHCRFPAAHPKITLIDLSPGVLAAASRRLERFQPETLVRDVLQPLGLGHRRFDSVGMNFLLHCLPGDMAAKARVFEEVLPFLAPGARVFGTTVAGPGGDHSRAARLLLARLNSDRRFCNSGDSAAALDAVLGARFRSHQIRQQGSAVLFEARL